MYAAFPESGFYDFGGIPPPEQAYMTAPTMMASGLSMYQPGGGRVLPASNRPYKLAAPGSCPPHIMQEYIQRLEAELSNSTPIFGGDSPAQVTSSVYLGAFRHAENGQELARMGVTHVLNCARGCCGNHDDSFYAPLNIMVQSMEASDSPGFQMLNTNFDVAYDFLEHCRQSGGRVLIHCYQGVNRSAVICLAYLMVSRRWSMMRAVRRVRAQRPFILSNTGFQEQLIEFAYVNGLLDGHKAPAGPTPYPTPTGVPYGYNDNTLAGYPTVWPPQQPESYGPLYDPYGNPYDQFAPGGPPAKKGFKNVVRSIFCLSV